MALIEILIRKLTLNKFDYDYTIIKTIVDHKSLISYQ